MKIAYFDCQSGISGDMILGALIDLGIPLKDIRKGLSTLNLPGYQIKSKGIKRGGISGSKINIVLNKTKGPQKSRNFKDIENLIKKSKLPNEVKENSIEIFRLLGNAEAKVHKTTLNKVHFHEVGAIDSIIDVVGGVYGIYLLGVDEVISSALNTGEGTVNCEHGILPVPAPATIKLLEGIPCFSSGVKKELTTPTGAAMIHHFAKKFGSMPLMTIIKSGYGGGDHIVKEQPNLLRIIFGKSDRPALEKITLIETNIDDMNPEFFEQIMENLFKAGAVDVYYSSIFMKKNRPGIKLSVLCPIHKLDVLSQIILNQTTTFGIRTIEMDRMILDREIVDVKTPWGTAKIKIGKLDGEIIQSSPEYKSCLQMAKKNNIPIKTIYKFLEGKILKE